MQERYPSAEWVPWKYSGDDGGYSFYLNQNQPIAAVLHRAQGYESTIRQWATIGYNGASWPFTVCTDGRVLQHLNLTDGGYHAGIAEYRDIAKRYSNPEPIWPLWKGWSTNVNHYTIGIEFVGFSGEPLTAAQMKSGRELCKWLAQNCGFKFDRDHFPPHADIALIDRANDFNTPELREEFYQYLFAPEETVPEPFDFTKVRLEPIGSMIVDWTDKPDERKLTQIVKILYDG